MSVQWVVGRNVACYVCTEVRNINHDHEYWVMSKILEIENLTVSFDGFKALNNLNFSMNTGELRVIIGPNGAGKTTFLDVITGKACYVSTHYLTNSLISHLSLAAPQDLLSNWGR